MNCLHCKQVVPLMQSLVLRGAPFCCEAHRKEYHLETQRLMLARLMETLPRYSNGRVREVTVAPQAPREERTQVVALRSLAVS